MIVLQRIGEIWIVYADPHHLGRVVAGNFICGGEHAAVSNAVASADDPWICRVRKRNARREIVAVAVVRERCEFVHFRRSAGNFVTQAQSERQTGGRFPLIVHETIEIRIAKTAIQVSDRDLVTGWRSGQKIFNGAAAKVWTVAEVSTSLKTLQII